MYHLRWFHFRDTDGMETNGRERNAVGGTCLLKILGVEVQHQIVITLGSTEEECGMVFVNMKSSPTGTGGNMLMADDYNYTVQTKKMSTTGVGNL